MKPQPCAAFVIVLLAFGQVPVIGSVHVNVALAWICAALAFCAVDSLMERKKHAHRR